MDPSDIDLTGLADVYGRLIALRGGCRCTNDWPCRACLDPMTEYEAAQIGLSREIAGRLGLKPQEKRL